jgi:hypothetical protein
MFKQMFLIIVVTFVLSFTLLNSYSQTIPTKAEPNTFTAQFVGNPNNISPFVTYDHNPLVSGSCNNGDYIFINSSYIGNTGPRIRQEYAQICSNNAYINIGYIPNYDVLPTFNLPDGNFEIYVTQVPQSEINRPEDISQFGLFGLFPPLTPYTKENLDILFAGKQTITLSGIVHFPAFVTVDPSVALDNTNSPVITGTCEDESDIDITIKTGNIDPLLQTLQQTIPTFKCPANGRYSSVPILPIPGGNYCIVIDLFDPVTYGTVLPINDNRAKATVCGVKPPLPLSSGGSVISIRTAEAGISSVLSPTLRNQNTLEIINLSITDPYSCNKGIYGKVIYNGDIKNLNKPNILIEGNGKSISYTPELNDNNEFNVKPALAIGDYKVTFSVSDMSGQTEKGVYSINKTQECVSTLPSSAAILSTAVGKGESTIRTGGY